MSTPNRMSRLLGRAAAGVFAFALLACGSWAQVTTTTTVEHGTPSFDTQVKNAEVVYVEGNNLVLKGDDGQLEHLVVLDSDRFKIDGRNVSVHELIPGTKLTQTITTTTSPRYVTTVQTIKGKVWHVNAAGSSVIVSLGNGKHQPYQISNHAKLLIGGKPKTVFDLRRGMQLEVTTVTDDTHTVIQHEKTFVGEAPAPSVKQTGFSMLVLLQPTRVYVPPPVLLASAEEPASTLPKTGTLLPLAALLGMLAVGLSLGLRVVRQAHGA